MRNNFIDETGIEKIYKMARMIIYLIPVVIVVFGIYIILFPVSDYNFYADQPDHSKFTPAKNTALNEISFGIFPPKEYRFINLDINFKKTEKKGCEENDIDVYLEKTFQAFLYSDGDTINDEDALRKILFDENDTKYPNGSLLHSTATNEVFFISHGARILFPGPDIFSAFGFSFENLADVSNSTLDQFPDADKKNLLWTDPHPDGTVFQTFPSHNLYIVSDGKKHLIASKDLFDKVWPEKNYSVSVSDLDQSRRFLCEVTSKQLSNQRLICHFDGTDLPTSLGKYYNFTLKYPGACGVENVHISNAQISLASERSFATVKNSIKDIVASLLNRYVYKNY